jgi:hypothetical protein
LYSAEGRPLVAKFHLCFRRVHIHVNHARVNKHMNNAHGVPADHQQRMVRLRNRVLQHSALNGPAVDKEVHCGTVGTRNGGRGCITVNIDLLQTDRTGRLAALRLKTDRQKGARNLCPIDASRRLPEVAVAR